MKMSEAIEAAIKEAVCYDDDSCAKCAWFVNLEPKDSCCTRFSTEIKVSLEGRCDRFEGKENET